MYFTLSRQIFGDRTAFGYSHSGASERTGKCTVKDAVEILDENLLNYEWKYHRWNGDILAVEFENKVDANQLIDTVVLQPEDYVEFLVLKKWEKDNGFI